MDIINKKYNHVGGDSIIVKKILPGFNNHSEAKYCMCEINKANGDVIPEYIMRESNLILMLINQEIVEE